MERQIMSQRVLIIGAGLAGPAAALFLQKAGFEPVIFEAYPGRADNGGALMLAPNGMAVMAELGLAERVIAAGTVIERFDFRSCRGFRLGSMPYAPKGRYRCPGVSLARATLYGILLDAVAERGIAVHYGKRLVAIEEGAGAVIARFADGDSLAGDLAVGADGIRSRVRELVLPQAPKPAFTGLIGAGGFLAREDLVALVGAQAQGTMSFCFGPGAFFGYAFGDRGARNGAYWWHALACDRPPSPSERRDFTGQAGIEALLRAGHGWHERVRAILAATREHIGPVDIYDVASLPRWSNGRTVLVGDAAHAVSPHSGQGASMALEDAIVLAKALRRQGGHERAFAAFEAERRPRAERVIAFGRRSGEQKRGGRLASAFGTLLMPIFLRLMPAPHWLYGHEIGWADEGPNL